MQDWTAALTLLTAFVVDRLWGEPRARLHPVVWMGNYLQWAGRHIAPVAASRGADWGALGAGALAWSVGMLGVLVASWLVLMLAAALPWPVAGVLLGLLLKPMLAWRMLHGEVAAVEAALAESLDAGRDRLARIVSRDVSQLTEAQVRESAIESLAENLNDSVVAPVFWFVLFGLPGAAAYRFANTADAMWGYRGLRGGRCWEWAGKWAARADDVLSWLPARITAMLLLASAKKGWALARRLRTEADRTPSPNSGWPMAAMALNLDVTLCKPAVYALNPLGHTVVADDTVRSLRYASRAVAGTMVIALGAVLLMAGGGSW